ncbi:hypothetical protein LTR86_005518 [Recurvomyces mirabilis]|nr:hypothetical protein LTR86_005518 [Recurvomyces mirabilis]
MPTILRNPFRKQDENLRPSQQANNAIEQRVNGTGNAKTVEVPQVKESTEYKLSEINDSGVYLPPSPTERKSFWSTTSSRSTTSTSNKTNNNNSNRPNLLSSDNNDQFSISRESFDSYRRSFDISARSPVINALETSRPPRASLDGRTFYPPPRASFESRGSGNGKGGFLQAPPPRSSNSFTRPSQVPAETREEEGEPNTTSSNSAQQQGFEDVDIADKTPLAAGGAGAGGKRGLFSRITGYGDHSSERPSSSSSGADGKPWHHFGGRRRGQSGQGAELGAIPMKKEDGMVGGKAESSLKKEVVERKEGVDTTTTLTPTTTAGKTATNETLPKPVVGARAEKATPVPAVSAEEQAVAGATKEGLGESPVDSGVDVEQEMREVSLDDAPAAPPEIKIQATKVSSAEDRENADALRPRTARAPEISQG